MKRLASMAAVVCVAGALGACGDSEETTKTTKTTGTASAAKACPTTGTGTDGAYASSFEGDVTKNAKKHTLVMTRDGKPVTGASVCVNTAMVGMTSMRYSTRGREIAPGRYEVPVKFEMAGTYRGNVVTEVADDSILVPLTVKVGAGAMDDDDKMDGTMKDDKMDDDGTMDDEDGK